MSEVFAYDNGLVVKLDRPEWNGVAAFEAEVITRLHSAGLPVARSHGVVTIDGRTGVVLDRIEGHPLADALMGAANTATIDELAEAFANLHRHINDTAMPGLPDLVERLHDELGQGGLDPNLVDELRVSLAERDDGRRGVCHYDFHPRNILVSQDEGRWIVIDWLTVASGPPVADLARTLVLWGMVPDEAVVRFRHGIRRHGVVQRATDDATCDAWIRIVAGARLAEGFSGAEGDWLAAVARGEIRLR